MEKEQIRRHAISRSKVKDCIVTDCMRQSFALSMCRSHYYSDLAKRNGICTVDGCQNHAKMGKLKICQKHYYLTDNQVDKEMFKKYGITLLEYKEMEIKQNFKCAICLRPPFGRNAINNRFDIDHNHETGKVRGLLCSDCNTSLGKFEDSIERLQRAIAYLLNNVCPRCQD